MPEEEEDVKENDEAFHKAFKKLKVDPKWDETKLIEKSASFSMQELWAGKSADCIEQSKADTPKKHQKHKSTMCGKKHRRQPYPCEKLPSMDKLSFAKEECKNKHCLCNRNHKHLGAGQRGVFQYPKVCEGSSKASTGRAFIRDARLKIHHREKDSKTLIRAARLKLAKQNKTRQPAILSTVRVCPDVKGVGRSTVFGEGKSSPSYKEIMNKDRSDGSGTSTCKNFIGSSFELYRHSQPSKNHTRAMQHGAFSVGGLRDSLQSATQRDKVEISSKDSLSGASQGKKRHCTCSQEARLDDLSVDELACYFEDFVYIPKKMSSMAEMMYT